MTATATLSTKSQVVIPRAVRKILNIGPSDTIEFIVTDSSVSIKKVPTVDEMYGSIKTSKVVSKAEMKRAIAQGVAEKFSRRK